MKAVIRANGETHGLASVQLLGNNIEAYENTVPSMLSDRLRNAKFSGPENPQTGIAPEWEPNMNNMTGLACKLVPGMYLSGREAQLIHNYAEKHPNGIIQVGVPLRAGEPFELEVWARAQHRPVTVSVELRFPGCTAPEEAKGSLDIVHTHWHRCTCRLQSPGDGKATLFLLLPGDSRIVLDQVHLRPVGEPHLSKAVAEVFDQVPCPVLRFPGGCATCTYHWEHGTGPVHLRPVCDDPVFRYKMHYDFGTDEFIDLCIERNLRPFLTLNTTTATPEDAAAWARYVRNRYLERGLEIPSAYILVGNENYWIHEIGHMTPEMYVAQLREFVPPLREAYPEARIVALGEFEGRGLRGGNVPWRSVVLDQAKGLFDLLSVTRYYHSSDNLTLAESMARVANNVVNAEADLVRQVRTVREAGLDDPVGIAEWNYWTRASHNDHAGFYEPNDIRHCLFAVGYLNACCRRGEDLEFANYYSLINTMGMVHLHAGEARISDVAKVLQLYAPALPGEVLRLDLDAPALTEKSKVVEACVLRKDGACFGFLVNFSAEDSVEVTLEGLGEILEAQGLRSDAILTPVEEFTPPFRGRILTLPPSSLVRVRCS